MIDELEQKHIFELIAETLTEDVECICFGGTAMIFYQIKNSTKDIDIVFENGRSANIFIKALEKLGYQNKQRLLRIYSTEKQTENYVPKMFVRSEKERFDVFTKKIFQTVITPSILQRTTQIHDFQFKKRLRIRVVSLEDLVLLKSVTSRERDFDDIVEILQKTPTFSWKTLIEETLLQTKLGGGWAKLDVEQTLLKLKNHVEIPKEYFDLLYG